MSNPNGNTRARGNPTWGRGGGKIKAESPTAFELMADSLNISPERYFYSDRLRKWAKNNANKRYVPEDLLRAWGIDPEKVHMNGRTAEEIL